MSAVDADLIPGLKARDEGTVTELVDRYWERAYRVACQLTGDTGAAEDVAQETFVAALRGVAKLKEGDPFRAWFFRILENTAKKHHRSGARRSTHERRAPQRSGAAPSPAESLEQAEDVELVRRYLRELSPKLRHTLALRYLEGMSLGEVARALDIPRKTVSSRVKRGLESLRVSLQPALQVSAGALAGLLASAMALPAPQGPTAGAILVQPPVPVPAAELIAAARAGRLAPALALGLTAALMALVSWVLASPGLGPEPQDDQVGLNQDAPEELDGPGTPRGDKAEEEDTTPRADGARSAESEPAPARGPATDSAAELPRLIEHPEPSAPKGEIQVSGRVLHADTGEPVGGVEVYKLWQGSQGKYSLAGKSAISDPAGRFTLVVTDRGISAVGLVTRHPGFRPSVRGLSLEAARKPLEVRVAPGEPARVVGRVLRPDGTPATKVEPMLTLQFETREAGLLNGEPAPAALFKGRLLAKLKTDAAGRFALAGLPAGEAKVSVRQAWRGFLHTTEKGHAAVDSEEIVIQLASGGTLVVDVRDRAGAPQPKAAVEARLVPETPYPPLSNALQYKNSKRTLTQTHGLATLHLKPGTYELRVVFPAAPPSRETTLRTLRLLETLPDHVARVTVEAGREERVTVQQNDENRGTLTVEVNDSAGTPQAGVKVWLNNAGRSWYDALQVDTDAEGRAVFPNLPHGRYGLQTAQKPYGDPEQTVVVNGAAKAVCLAAVPLSSIEGIVVDEAGRPVPNATVYLIPIRTGVGDRNVETDDEGRFRVAAYPKGLVDVRVDAPGFLTLSTTKRNDGQAWRLVLTAGRTLVARGQVDAPDGTPVRLYTRWGGATGKVVANRFAMAISNLDRTVAGELWLRVGETVPVHVPFVAGQTEVEFGALTLQPGRTVRGRLKVPAAWQGPFTGRVAGGEPFAFHECEVDRDGRFELRGLPDAPLDLRASLRLPGPEGEYRAATVRVDPVGAPDLGEIELQVQTPHVPEERDPR